MYLLFGRTGGGGGARYPPASVYDRPGVRIQLKVRMLKAEVIATLLDGCMTRSPKKHDYNRLRHVHHSTLHRCLGWRKQKRDEHTLSCADAIAQPDSESIGAIVRKRRILFPGFVERTA